MTLDTFRQQAFASALTATRERGASAFCPHTRPKTVLLLASPFGWLISAFHKTEKSAPRELRAVTLGWGGGLSTRSGARCRSIDCCSRLREAYGAAGRTRLRI